MEEEESIQIIMLCEQEIWPDYHISQRLALSPSLTTRTHIHNISCWFVLGSFCPRFCTFVEGILFVCLFICFCLCFHGVYSSFMFIPELIYA